jgi:hypothetical protein
VAAPLQRALWHPALISGLVCPFLSLWRLDESLELLYWRKFSITRPRTLFFWGFLNIRKFPFVLNGTVLATSAATISFQNT